MSSFGASWARAIAAAALFVGILAAFPHNSYALDGNKYCSAGPDPTKTADTIAGSLLSVDDVKLWAGSVYTSSNCYGDFDPGNSSPANETAAINQIFGDISGPNQFTYLDKTGGAANASGLGGIKFEVHTLGGDNGTPGLWTIFWTDIGGATSEFPLKIDLAVLLVGGNHSAVYLISGVLVPFSPGIGFGSFDIQFPNGGNTLASWWCYRENDDDNRHHKSARGRNSSKGGKHDDKDDKDKCKPNQPDLSHLLIAGRIVTTTQEVPEPTSLAMFGVGLVGFWAFSRRRVR